MTAEVDILIGTYSDVIAIPIGAITEHFQRTWVYVMQGEQGERRAVTTGRMTHSFVEVTEGLQAGEVVALDAYQRGLADFAESERDGPGDEADAEAGTTESEAATGSTASSGAT
jgi:hypothetical protein